MPALQSYIQRGDLPVHAFEHQEAHVLKAINGHEGRGAAQ
jgi:hypothetical protein